MKLSIKLFLASLGILSLLLLSSCSNTNTGCTSDAECGSNKCVSGACVQCRADTDCNAGNACMVCSNNSCTQKSNCCTTDLECGQGKRCWNVRGKAYGTCGSANR